MTRQQLIEALRKRATSFAKVGPAFKPGTLSLSTAELLNMAADMLQADGKEDKP